MIDYTLNLILLSKLIYFNFEHVLVSYISSGFFYCPVRNQTLISNTTMNNLSPTIINFGSSYSTISNSIMYNF